MATPLEEERLAALVRDRWVNGPTTGRKLCLFLGAGADISSGGLTFWHFKRICYERLTGVPAINLQSSEDVDSAFETVFKSGLPENERAVIVERIFRDAGALEPSESYKILALLLKLGGLDAVITTNFDTMLERAADDLGVRSFSVYSPKVSCPVQLSGTYLHGSRPPYIKVHGDLESRIVTVITAAEIETGNYEKEFEGIIRELASTHHFVLAGYSGYDLRLAELISAAQIGTENVLFWCNPARPDPNAPLIKKADPNRLVWLDVSFDRCVEILAREPLERPAGLSKGNSFLRTVLDWRISFANRQFERACDLKSIRTAIRRDAPESEVRKFLRSSKNIGVVIGPSGYGKTTLVRRLAASIGGGAQSSRAIVIDAKALDTTGIELAILRLCAPAAPELGLTSFERWLQSQSTRLVIFVDGLNEYSADVNDCAQLFRTILRLGFSLPERAQVRFLVTMRHETWNHIRARVDAIQLGAAMWSPGPDDSARLQPIALNRFSNSEVDSVLARRRDEGETTWDRSELTPWALELLRDPFLLNAALDSEIAPPGVSSSGDLMNRYIERKLDGVDPHTHQSAIDALKVLAGLCFSRRVRRFRAVDLERACFGNGDAVRVIGDSGLIEPRDGGWFRFEHDRTEEYFLAHAIADGDEAPALESLQDLADMLKEAPDEDLLFAAARRHLRSQPHLFRIVEQGQALRLDSSPFDNDLTRHIRAFTKESLQEAAFDAPNYVTAYGKGAVSASLAGHLDADQTSAALQAVALLDDDNSIPILLRACDISDPVLSNEAWIYLSDRLGDRLAKGAVDLTKQPWSRIIENEDQTGWRAVCRLLGLLAVAGPDNLVRSHYAELSKDFDQRLTALSVSLSLKDSDMAAMTDAIIANLDRYAFNALPSEIDAFFANPERAVLVRHLKALQEKGTLSATDIGELTPFMNAAEHHFEFLVLNVLFALSALNDFDATRSAFQIHCEGFDSQTFAEEIDFFSGVAGYIYVVCDRPYDGLIDNLIERMPHHFPQVFYHNPGQRRGEIRGWRDSFDMMFEDGFNPVAGYPLLAAGRLPENLWQKMQNGEVLEETELSQVFPVYQKIMADLIEEKAFDKLVRIIHALGQTFSVWPLQALYALLPIVGIQDVLVRRALVRMLSESFARRPIATQAFLDMSQGAFSREELAGIRAGETARVGHRQFETIEWARILHFLIVVRPNGILAAIDCLIIVCEASSLQEAIEKVLIRLKLA